MEYTITFNTTASLPIKVGETPTGTYGRVTAPSRHIGKVVLKLDGAKVLCLNDARTWTRFGNVFIEPLAMGESIVVQSEPEFEDVYADLDW